tara:strand:- start:933 stop:1412 length:480 start_codon:yes stop_codon:yes gene_type:complete
MKKNWLVATYKINRVKILERNLQNQNFDYYLPKIITKKINSNPKIEALFPGYIFVNTSLKNCSALKYTKGITNIIKFGNNFSYISNKEIKVMKMIEESSKIDPLVLKLDLGQDVMITKGSFRGNIVKVCSLPVKERVGILLYFLGSKRRATISEKDLIF